jgi:hypothetical protein
VQGWVTDVAPAGLVTSLAVATVEAQGLVDQMPVQFTVQGTPLRARLLSEATFRELAASADDLARLGVDVVGVLDEDGYVVIVGLYGDLGAAFGIRPGAPVVLQAR